MLTLLLICPHSCTWRKPLAVAVSRYLNLELTDGCFLQGESYFLKRTAKEFYSVERKVTVLQVFLSGGKPGSCTGQNDHFCVSHREHFHVITGACKTSVPANQNKFLHIYNHFLSSLFPFTLSSCLLRDLPSSVLSWSVRVCVCTYACKHKHVCAFIYAHMQINQLQNLFNDWTAVN